MKDNGVEGQAHMGYGIRLGRTEAVSLRRDGGGVCGTVVHTQLDSRRDPQRVYWYAWDNHSWVTIETTGTDNKTVRPAGQAYGAIQKWLSGASNGRV